MGLILLALPISIGASLCQFCLGPRSVAYQAYPWSGFRPYGWQDVSSVTATCHYRSGRYGGMGQATRCQPFSLRRIKKGTSFSGQHDETVEDRRSSLLAIERRRKR